MADTQYYGTGRRKDATSRVWIKPGTGKVTVNGKKIEQYFVLCELNENEFNKAENQFNELTKLIK